MGRGQCPDMGSGSLETSPDPQWESLKQPCLPETSTSDLRAYSLPQDSRLCLP